MVNEVLALTRQQKERAKSGQETGGSHSKNLNGEWACMPDPIDLVRGVPYSSAVFLTVAHMPLEVSSGDLCFATEAVKTKRRGQLCHI